METTLTHYNQKSNMTRSDWSRYNINRKSLDELIKGRNEGDVLAKIRLEYILRMYAGLNNRNSGIASTIYNKSKQYSSVYVSSPQLNGLAFISIECNIAIPEYSPARNTHIDVYKPARKMSDVATTPAPAPNASAQVCPPDPNAIRLFDKVEFVDMTSGERLSMTIVKENQGDITKNHISIGSPIADALLGHLAGQVVSAVTPAGIRPLQISRIYR